MEDTCPKNKECEKNNLENKFNVYRDTALRYLGYLGHLGWICRSLIPFHLTSMASVSYICADAVQETSTAIRERSEKEILTTAAEVFLWHFLATFALPGIFLHGVNGVTRSLQSSRSKCQPRAQYFLLPCSLSALAIPFISKPIDHAVDDLMNKYFRKTTEKDCFEYEQVKTTSKEDQNKLSSKWFYDQSKDQNALDLERYHQKLKDKKNKQNTPPANDRDVMFPKSQEENSPENQNLGTSDGFEAKYVQVDKTTRPPKPKKNKEEPESQ